MTEIHGTVKPGFEAVEATFAANFDVEFAQQTGTDFGIVYVFGDADSVECPQTMFGRDVHP